VIIQKNLRRAKSFLVTLVATSSVSSEEEAWIEKYILGKGWALISGGYLL